MRHRIKTPNAVTVSYSKYGSGPPLVLVHGGFSDDITNWDFVRSLLEDRFTVYAIARRGRGETTATVGHSLQDEAKDVVAVIEEVSEPVFLLGHSYGALCSLAAAAQVPDRIRKLVLYEPPSPRLFPGDVMSRLEGLAGVGEWSDMAFTFFRDSLQVPLEILEELRDSDLWPPIVNDAKATLGDLRAVSRYDFSPDHFRQVRCPVLLQVGSESPRHVYLTDALLASLRDVRIEGLEGQAHEGMTTAPEMYAASVRKFLLG